MSGRKEVKEQFVRGRVRLLQDLVMANGGSDHDPPHAMQLRSMLGREEVNGNGNSLYD